jgi:hypothetical protein
MRSLGAHFRNTLLHKLNSCVTPTNLPLSLFGTLIFVVVQSRFFLLPVV